VIYSIERHHVIGEHDNQFEDLYEGTYLPLLGEADGARLLWYAQTPHGAGEAYLNVTVTGFTDLPAWEDWGERLRRGDLADWLEKADSCRYGSVGSLVSELPWSPLRLTELPPAAPGNGPPGLMRLDVLGAEKQEQLLAPDSWGVTPESGVLRLVAAFAPVLAPLENLRALLLYRIGSHDGLVGAFNVDKGEDPWPGACPLPSGVSHLETRVLRTTTWSPLA
jgi:hypothetical protein